MTEQEARDLARSMRKIAIGVTADQLEPDGPWSIRAWTSHKGTPELWYTTIEQMPAGWQTAIKEELQQ